MDTIECNWILEKMSNRMYKHINILFICADGHFMEEDKYG